MASNLYTETDKNIRKTWLLVTLFLVVVIGVGWFFSYLYESPVVLYIVVFVSIAMNIVSYWYSDKIVLSLHKAKIVTREEHFELWNLTENLAITAGLPMPKLYIVEDSMPNAFATGRDKEHGVVCVTTGLLHLLNKNELEGVIAHELSHIGNRDILLSTMVVVLVGCVVLISDIFLRSSMFGHRDRDGRLGGALFLVGVIAALLTPLVATLIQLAISRKREFLADSSGALLTRFPEGLASALRKIESSQIPMQTANRATAHMFIANPFGAKSVKTLNKMFMTHPPTEERIKALVG